MKLLIIIIIAVHGLIHLMGFAKAFGFAEIKDLTLDISRSSGLMWLLAAVLFVAAAVAVILNRQWWWMISIPALLLSQVLVIMYWHDAKFGTVANVIVLAAAALAYGNWHFDSMAQKELAALFSFAAPGKQIVTEDRWKVLPPVVRTWLSRSNVTGRDALRTVHLKQTGEMRTTPGGGWMPFEAEQWFTTEKPGFVWIADVTAAPGVHLAGIDRYIEGKGGMLIKLLSLITVVDARGREIDQGTMLRYLAEIVWFPSAALNDCITWEPAGKNSARASMNLGGVSASGVFTFDAKGDVEGFEAMRYYSRKDGATLEKWVIDIDTGSFREFEGVRVPAKSTVTWKLNNGDFTWFRLTITDIRYNETVTVHLPYRPAVR
jgi:hypothetical protein